MFTVVITSIPARRRSSTSWARFSCLLPGTLVCASSSTQDDGRPARDDRLGVHLRERGAAVHHLLARDDLQTLEHLDGVLAPVRSRRSRRPGRCRGRPGVDPRRASRTSCRRRVPRRGRPSAGHDARRSWVQSPSAVPMSPWLRGCEVLDREVEHQHVDAGFAEHAEGPAGGVFVDEVRAAAPRSGPAPRRRAAPAARRTPRRCPGRDRMPTRSPRPAGRPTPRRPRARRSRSSGPGSTRSAQGPPDRSWSRTSRACRSRHRPPTGGAGTGRGRPRAGRSAPSRPPCPGRWCARPTR